MPEKRRHYKVLGLIISILPAWFLHFNLRADTWPVVLTGWDNFSRTSRQARFQEKLDIVSTQALASMTLRQRETVFTSLPVIP
jgi:hypothetical protein